MSEVAKSIAVGPPSHNSRATREPLMAAVCLYCANPLFQLDIFCKGSFIEGCVCTEGHFVLGVTDQEFAEAVGLERLQGSRIVQSGAAKFMCQHLPKPDKITTLQEGMKFVQGLDLTTLVQVAGRLTSLLRLLEESGYYESTYDLYRALWASLDLYTLDRFVGEYTYDLFVRESEADWTKLFDAILNGQTDPQVEMTTIITRKERREALEKAMYAEGYSFQNACHPDSIEEYLQVSTAARPLFST